MQYHFRIHKEKKGYWAECLELRGCVTEGNSIDDLRHNMEEALNAYLDEPESSKVLFPLPKSIRTKRNVETVSVDPQVAFAFLIRRQRLLEGKTQSWVAEQLGVRLWSYQRLERSKTANPRLGTIAKLLAIFPGLELNKTFA